MRRVMGVVLIVLLSSLTAAPVLSAPALQDGGGIRFGAFTLAVGERYAGDLVVFGGPVELRSTSIFRGDLTVLGDATIEEGAELDGQLIVLGHGDVAGVVEGDIFVVDGIVLRSTAHIRGDVTVVGEVDSRSGAVIEGELRSASRDEAMRWTPLFRDPEGGISVPVPSPRATFGARLAALMWRVVRGIASVVVIGLLALVIASLWPVHMERVGRVVEEAPLATYAVGLLTLIVAALASALLAITICLSPFAMAGVVVVGVGLLLGWVGLGAVLGRRMLSAIFPQTTPTPAVAAVTGTAILALLLAVSRFFGALHGLFLLLILPFAAGAVLLTRFGSRPYATREGVPSASAARPTLGTGERAPRVAPRPAPLPGDALETSEGEPNG
jgi:cytoskeletal protein CcmA (bactofilin family)